ncbi:hypothetical protein J5N97_008554 [Dioscorea zingiberensis]|uniref:Uncharacterized protein n=1 Tax=Dioscorea zingiberensis TaxID=325984 RepID=A0A9D5HKW2_9LILI|nr:hypothetical protein J5N97_008554 [Dioscorea zingiberensis]
MGLRFGRKLSRKEHFLIVVFRMQPFPSWLAPIAAFVGMICIQELKIQCVRSFSDFQGFGVGSIDGRVALKFLDQSKSSAMGCVFRCHPKLKERKYHLVAVNDIAFHPRFDTFVTGDNKGYAFIWDAQSRKKLYEFQRSSSSVACLSYNYIGQLLAVASGHA